MELTFFHFAHNPFVVQPDATQLFRNRGQQRALQAIACGIEGRKGMMAILGTRGMGKTTLMRAYVELRQQHNIQTIVMSGLGASFRLILERLCQHCEVPVIDADRETTLRRLWAALTREYEQGTRVALVIEAADNLNFSTLEDMLVLTEMENESGKLLQIFLLAEPEFERQLQRAGSPELKQGIQVRVRLTPFTESESVSYVKQQIASVALLDEQPFTPGALKRIAQYGKGNPGILNFICNESLGQAIRQQQKPITAALVKDVLSDLDGVEPVSVWRWTVAGCVAVMVALGLFLGAPNLSALWPRSQSSPDPPASALSKDAVPSAPPLKRLASLPVSAAGASSNGVARRARTAAAQELAGLGGDAANNPLRPPRAGGRVPEPSTGAIDQPLSKGTPRGSPAAVLDQSSGAKPGVGASGVLSTTPEAETSVVCLTARVDGNRQRDIVLVDAAGKIRRRLVANGALNLAPSLSPDGNMLAYTSYRGGAPAIYLRNLKKAQDERLTFRPGFALPGAWALNGRYLVLSKSESGNSDIFLYDQHRRHLRRLTLHRGIDILPSFAPDSHRVVFTSNRTGSLQVYLTTVDGRSPVRLTQQGDYNTSGIWSPRSDVIAFIGRGADQSLNLYTIRADGTGRRQVTRDGNVVEEAPAWSPDGQSIMYTRTDNGKRQRRIVRVDGSSSRELPGHGATCYAPQWVALQTVN